MSGKNKRVGVAIVTYNRLEKLKTALKCFANQTYKIDYIVIVDNASNDGTKAFLNKWTTIEESFKKIVIRQSENSGGSGGFHVALTQAVKMDADWIWVSDDDAFPEPDAIEILNDYLVSHDSDEISAVCSSVINHGRFDLGHRVRFSVQGNTVKTQNVEIKEYENPSFEFNAFSYVGSLINKQKMLQVGVTRKDFFIWCDDAEHSLRLSKIGKIICIPASKVNHDQEIQKGITKISWKTYYGIRNNYVMYETLFSKGCARRYFIIHILKIYKIILKAIIKKEKIMECVKLYITALMDGKNHKMGIHPIYRPGWNPER